MIIIKKNPGTEYFVTEIDNTLEAMQKAVGGYIETVRIADDCVIVCDEEGVIKDLPYNTNLAGVGFYGPIFICGVKGEEFCDVPQILAPLLGVKS